MNLSGKAWTPEEMAKMHQFIADGLTQTEASTKFPGRTIAAAERKYRKVRLSMGIIPTPAAPRMLYCKQTDAEVEASDTAYSRWRLRDAKRGCRLLKEAMDQYYANHQQAA